MPPISILIKPASGLCNLRCDYCFYCDEMQNRMQKSYGIMTSEILEAIIKKILSYADGTCGIAFQGGEPTLAGLPFFEQAIAFQYKHNSKKVHICNSIQTNGINLDGSWARFFSNNRFLVGLSLDGIKSTHNAFRKDMNGKDTFLNVMDTALLFDVHKVEYNILTVINSKTVMNIDRIYSFYKRRGFRFLQFITCLDPLGKTPGQAEYSLTPEIFGRFLCDLFDLWYEDLLDNKHPYIRSFENYVGILCGIMPESCEMRGTCGVQYVIEADGSVYPCDFYALDEMRLGNLLTDSFDEIDKRRAELGFIKRSEEHAPDCASCKWFYLCRGGCMRNRILQDSESKNCFCSAYQRFFDHAFERLRKIAEVLRRDNRHLMQKRP